MATGMVIRDYTGASEVSIPGVLLQHRKLMLTGDITMESAQDFNSKLMCLLMENATEKIDVYINSLGGSIEAGLAIIDALKIAQNKINVNLICFGYCASMAAFILATGKKGHRFISEHGKTLINQPLVQGSICKNTSSVQEMAEHMIKVKDEMYQLLSAATGRSVDEIEQLTANGDHVMDAYESIDFGIVDAIYEDFDE